MKVKQDNKTIMALNKTWHLANKMPQHATLAQRIQWHTEHAKNCRCRPMPENIKAIVEKKRSNSNV